MEALGPLRPLSTCTVSQSQADRSEGFSSEAAFFSGQNGPIFLSMFRRRPYLPLLHRQAPHPYRRTPSRESTTFPSAMRHPLLGSLPTHLCTCPVLGCKCAVALQFLCFPGEHIESLDPRMCGPLLRFDRLSRRR